jgi:hypothetical protein
LGQGSILDSRTEESLQPKRDLGGSRPPRPTNLLTYIGCAPHARALRQPALRSRRLLPKKPRQRELYLSYGHLKLSPFWDPLRGDPRFEKIVASLAPKE